MAHRIAEPLAEKGNPHEVNERRCPQHNIIKDIKKHSFYLKPGDKRRAKQALARKRLRKTLMEETD